MMPVMIVCVFIYDNQIPHVFLQYILHPYTQDLRQNKKHTLSAVRKKYIYV